MKTAPPKIPVFATIGAAFRFFWHNRDPFYYLALPSVVVLSILSSIPGPSGLFDSFEMNFPGLYVQHSNPSGILPADVTLGSVLAFFVGLIIFPLYSVAWHRSFLLPGESVTIRECYHWRGRHWAFLWATVKVLLFLIPLALGGIALLGVLSPLFPLLGIIGIPTLVFFIIISYCRFSLWLPASAIDHQMDLKQVLALTKGNGWRLAGIFVLTGLFTALLDSIARGIIFVSAGSIGVLGELTSSLLTNLALYLVIYAGTAVGITALSMVYKMLVVHSQIERQKP